MPRLALNRKDKGQRFDGTTDPVTADSASLASKRFQYGGIVAGHRRANAGSRNCGYIAS
jgi:hypothetical protein